MLETDNKFTDYEEELVNLNYSVKKLEKQTFDIDS